MISFDRWMSKWWWMNSSDSRHRHSLVFSSMDFTHCSLEFVLKKKPKKVMNLEFMHRTSTTRTTLVQHETSSVNCSNMTSMSTGAPCMSCKLNIRYKLFDAIRVNVVDLGVRITSRCFLIDFFHRPFHSNEHPTAFVWRRRIIRKDSSTALCFNAFNFMEL